MVIKFFLLGYPRLVVQGEPVSLPRSKALALLSYLVVNRQIHSRDALVTLFWANYDQSSGRAELRRQISTLKKAISVDFLHVERDAVGIADHAPLWNDVTDIYHQMQQCKVHPHNSIVTCDVCIEQLEKVVALLNGNFMDGFTLPDSPAFDQWQHTHSQLLSENAQLSLETLAQYYAQQNNIEQAIALYIKLLTYNPGYEPAHRQLMRYFAENGNRADALKQYETCVAYLNSEFGVEPETETQQLYHSIRQNTLKPVQAVKPIAPIQPTKPFIGREAELETALTYLASSTCRLLTITGMGGVGALHKN